MAEPKSKNRKDDSGYTVNYTFPLDEYDKYQSLYDSMDRTAIGHPLLNGLVDSLYGDDNFVGNVRALEKCGIDGIYVDKDLRNVQSLPKDDPKYNYSMNTLNCLRDEADFINAERRKINNESPWMYNSTKLIGSMMSAIPNFLLNKVIK